ncbi:MULTISPECIES: HEPN domain-containing protein [Lysobacteraceae]|uniref:HEPN domain-containing protein n=1 Tax=Lysobacteraceae TaxID=32033 RepID=UPI001BCB6DFD|nr:MULTISPECIES: HEPN domain-containing protein [Lysobacter]
MDLLGIAINETLSMHGSSFDTWAQELPDEPFGPTIPAGDGLGFYRTSRVGMNAIVQIADALQANDQSTNRTVSQETIRHEAAKALGELLNEFAQSGNENANLARYKERLSDRLNQQKLKLTHYFAVWLFLGQEAADFNVGTVWFRSPANWLAEVERLRGQSSSWMCEVLERWSGDSKEESLSRTANVVARSVHSDQWVACVTTDGFEREESHRRALIAVRAAVDTLRLVVPHSHNSRLCLAVDHAPPINANRLTQRDNADLAIGTSFNPPGLSGAPGMGQTVLKQSEGLRDAAGRRIIIPLLANPEMAPCRKLSERWVNAVHWYGRGCSEEADFTAIVSFAIAMDILSGGLEDRGILELAARLLQIPYSRSVVGDGTTLKQLVARIYKYRSGIAHGSILALEERLRTERAKADVLASAILASYAIELDRYANSNGVDDRDTFRNTLLAVPDGP